MKPLYISKANTLVQIVLVVFVLAELAFGVDIGVGREMLVVLSGLLTAASAGAYLVPWLRHMTGNGEGASRSG